MKIGKYEFNSKEQFESKVESLNRLGKNDTISALGYAVIEEGTEETAPVFGDKYHVDVLWDIQDEYDIDGNVIEAKHPYGWKSYAVDFEEGQGMHSFLGLDYQSLKF